MSTDIDERVTKALDSIAELTLAIPDFIGMLAAQNVKPNMTQKERDDLIESIKWVLSKVPDTTKFLSDYATILAAHQNCKAAKENIQTTRELANYNKRLYWFTGLLAVATFLLAIPVLQGLLSPIIPSIYSSLP